MNIALEDQLLIQCSRVNMSEECIARTTNLLEQSLDWDYIFEASVRHAVSPLLYHGLKQVLQAVKVEEVSSLPQMQQLERIYQGNQGRNRRLYKVIGDIFKAFHRANIQAMGLKDVQLAREVYPDIGLRPMGDIDILIRPEDYRKAATCLADLGFVPLPNSSIPYTMKYAWAHHFQRPTDNVWIDLQWNVIQREWDIYEEGNFDFEIERMWRGAYFLEIEDYEILVPKPEDMLFHLCLHAEGHTYAELILFCDIAELLKHYNGRLDWKYLVGITKKYKAESSVYYVLLLVGHLFDLCLPPFVLEEITPTYFKANVFDPLFGNLTALHLSLDEITTAASPPDGLMREFEAAVRQQTVGAMQTYKEIDGFAARFINSGGAVIIPRGSFSEKVFPDRCLEPFKEIQLLVLNHDLACVREALTGGGFYLRAEEDHQTYTKSLEFASKDPALGGQETTITMQVVIEETLDGLLKNEESRDTSKKDIALKLLKTKLRNCESDKVNIPVRIRVNALSPDSMLVYLSFLLGKEKQYRLFGMCSLIEFFRCYADQLNWQQITTTAVRYSVAESVCEGLLVARELVGETTVPPLALHLLGCKSSLPRVLEWARYGPDSLLRYTGFKGIFFYVLSLLSVNGIKEKCGYLLTSFFGARGKKPVLPGLILELTASTISLLRNRSLSPRDFAYWLEPDSALKKGPVDN